MLKMFLAFVIICIAIYFGLRYITSLDGDELDTFLERTKIVSIIGSIAIFLVSLLVIIF